MARYAPGDVVIVPFPYTNQEAAKRRPAVVLSATGDNDVLVAMITSAAYGDETLPLDHKNLVSAGLRIACAIRPDRLLVVATNLVEKRTGRISRELLATTRAAIATWIQGQA